MFYLYIFRVFQIEDVSGCVGKGLESQEFIDLVFFLAQQIKDIEKLEEGVCAFKKGDDSQVRVDMDINLMKVYNYI